jgi:cytoplasmic iron level regulating protein YaaA (DUF328/UPF0246 family)
MSTSRTVYLVSCVSKKKRGKYPARDIYDSPRFRKARSYVEQHLQHGDKWFVLSTKHGLLCSDDVIEPYETTLNKMKRKERQDWAKQVLGSLKSVVRQADIVIILAGNRYREFLKEDLTDLCRRVEVPMEGLKIGEQLRWLEQELNGHE